MNINAEPSPPLVSIIIRTKNEERWIDHCLSAIATQSIKDYEIISYECELGDAIAFNYATIHAAYGNNSNNRRRAFSVRFTGDDARYIKRKGEMSPPFPNINLKNNEILDSETFPVLISS